MAYDYRLGGGSLVARGDDFGDHLCPIFLKHLEEREGVAESSTEIWQDEMGETP